MRACVCVCVSVCARAHVMKHFMCSSVRDVMRSSLSSLNSVWVRNVFMWAGAHG